MNNQSLKEDSENFEIKLEEILCVKQEEASIEEDEQEEEQDEG